MRICAADSIPMVKKAVVLVTLAALVIGTAPAAPALATAPSDPMAVPAIPTGWWRLVVTPDEAAVNEGRYGFEEYVLVESTTDVTAQEMSRLGFTPGKATAGKNLAGQTTFTAQLKSNCHGTVTWSGTFVSSTMVTGTLVWVKDGMTYNYNWTGAPYTPPTDVES